MANSNDFVECYLDPYVCYKFLLNLLIKLWSTPSFSITHNPLRLKEQRKIKEFPLVVKCIYFYFLLIHKSIFIHTKLHIGKYILVRLIYIWRICCICTACVVLHSSLLLLFIYSFSRFALQFLLDASCLKIFCKTQISKKHFELNFIFLI